MAVSGKTEGFEIPYLEESDIPDMGAGDKAIAGRVDELLGEIEPSQLTAAAKPVVWHSPKIIDTEQSTSSIAFTTLTAPDEISDIIVPEDGFISVRYRAFVKSSAKGGGHVGLFVGSNQVANIGGSALDGKVEVASGESGVFYAVTTGGSVGLELAGGGVEDVATGQILCGGAVDLFMPAGTYSLSVRYRASSGSVTAKNRKLWVEVHGS